MEPVTWITLLFSSMTLLGPATHYDVPAAREMLIADQNAAHVMASTAAVGNYHVTLTDWEVGRYWMLQSSGGLVTMLDSPEISTKQVFRVVEQNLIVSSGVPIFFGTKFKAPLQWAVLSTITIQMSDYWTKSSTGGWVLVSTPTRPRTEIQDHFIVNQSSTALVAKTLARVARTKEKYRIYRAEGYIAKDRYDFSFKKK